MFTNTYVFSITHWNSTTRITQAIATVTIEDANYYDATNCFELIRPSVVRKFRAQLKKEGTFEKYTNFYSHTLIGTSEDATKQIVTDILKSIMVMNNPRDKVSMARMRRLRGIYSMYKTNMTESTDSEVNRVLISKQLMDTCGPEDCGQILTTGTLDQFVLTGKLG